MHVNAANAIQLAMAFNNATVVVEIDQCFCSKYLSRYLAVTYQIAWNVTSMI